MQTYQTFEGSLFIYYLDNYLVFNEPHIHMVVLFKFIITLLSIKVATYEWCKIPIKLWWWNTYIVINGQFCTANWRAAATYVRLAMGLKLTVP